MMTLLQKFGISFALALSIHIMILLLFGINFSAEKKDIKQHALPEIIQASVLDDEKILLEAERLKTEETNKRLSKQKKQQALENKIKKEQERLQQAKRKRQQEEQAAKQLAEKTKQLAKEEKQKLENLRKEKALEAARLAKIKEQKLAEQKRLQEQKLAEQKRQEELRIAKEKQQQLERQAEEKRKQALIAKQKADEEAKQALFKKQAAEAKARAEQNKKATRSATAAIQQKVNNHWIRPPNSSNGLHCTIRVKLLPSGDVMEVTVIKSSGDTIFDRSAENAVRKASPLPVPKDRTLFASQFRRFTFEFKPH